MSLSVEVAGYGICQTSPPFPVLVICVQQEQFQAWTVYRRGSSFEALAEQLHPNILPVPFFDHEDLAHENLESCRIAMDIWLQSVSSNPMVLRTQSMYQFLCVDANMPPPYLEIYWKNGNSGSFEEMEMDDMFDKHLDDNESIMLGEDGGDESVGSVGDDNDWEDNDHHEHHQQQQGADGKQQTIFAFDRPAGAKTKSASRKGQSGASSKRSNTDAMDDDEKDGFDIQSLSVVEAEFLYNRENEGKSAEEVAKRKNTINLEAFHLIKVIGKGSFGKVFLVREKATGTIHAMKVLKKDYIIRKNQVEHTKTERSVLGYIHHPYIVGLTMAFQTADKLFFVLDYCAGGELFFHLGKVGRFSEDRAKFYAAQITLALEYVHGLDVVYRDLKPENVLLDQNGNVRLTDFGLSKEGVSDHSTGANSFCGTPEYIAPEVLLRQGHGRAVDWWSLGALLYEMITGLPPFYSRNRETMFEKIMKADLTFPQMMTEEAKDILSKLIVRDPKERLGSGERDATELKEHPFFAGIDWEELATGRVIAPWAPTVAGSLDTSQFDQEFTSMPPIVTPDVRDAYFGSLDRAFEGFTFVDNSAGHMMSASVRTGPGATTLMMATRGR